MESIWSSTDWAPSSVVPSKPLRKTPISNPHHSKHTINMPGTAIRANLPQSWRHSTLHPKKIQKNLLGTATKIFNED